MRVRWGCQHSRPCLPTGHGASHTAWTGTDSIRSRAPSMMRQATLASVESDLGAPPDQPADVLSPDSSVEATTDNAAPSDRPYHSKRPHKKSRAGCRQCKTRKVKVSQYQGQLGSPSPRLTLVPSAMREGRRAVRVRCAGRAVSTRAERPRPGLSPPAPTSRGLPRRQRPLRPVSVRRLPGRTGPPTRTRSSCRSPFSRPPPWPMPPI